MVRYGQGLKICKRRSKGKMCGGMNPPRAKKCARCEKPLPKARKRKDMVALEQGYEHYLELNEGIELCAICGAAPKAKRLQRDHDHKSGRPRGLLCAQCNMRLKAVFTSKWLRDAADYLDARDPALKEIPF